MKPLCTAAQMRELDRWTIDEFGLPGPVLMENAGLGQARLIHEAFGPVDGLRVAVLCGSGNNGGDGFVIGRWLDRWGARVSFFVLTEPVMISGDAEVNYRAANQLQLPIKPVLEEADLDLLAAELEAAYLIVDGLLGTGLNSPVRGLYAKAIELVNKVPTPVSAVDIPSGLNADTGRVMGDAVRADLTATFGAAKVGQAIHPGLEHCGRLEIVDIGLPDSAPGWADVRTFLIEPGDVAALWPRLPDDGHKGTAGHLAIIAGSPGKTGAAVLTAEGALRSGAGLVTVACAEGIHPILEAKLTEAMTEPLSQTESGSLAREAIEDLAPLMQAKSALVVGPGLTTNNQVGEVLAWLIERVPLPLVIDADGLNLLSDRLEVVKWAAEGAVLTPHPGEMARLLGKSTIEVQTDRLGAARQLSAETGQVVVLKGARTIIADPDGDLFINPSGNPGLASGGTGDVLAGIIGGLLAQGLSPLKAAICGVYTHGLAADLLLTEAGNRGYLASEVAAALPRALGRLET